MKKNRNAEAWKRIQEEGLTVRGDVFSDAYDHDVYAGVALVDKDNVPVRNIGWMPFRNNWKGARDAAHDLAQTVHEETGIPLWRHTPERYHAPAPTALEIAGDKHRAKREVQAVAEDTAQRQLGIVAFLLFLAVALPVAWMVVDALGFWLGVPVLCVLYAGVRRVLSL